MSESLFVSISCKACHCVLSMAWLGSRGQFVRMSTLCRFPLSEHICLLDAHVGAPEYVEKNPIYDIQSVTEAAEGDKVDILTNWPREPSILELQHVRQASKCVQKEEIYIVS
jgi:hypothetical protein